MEATWSQNGALDNSGDWSDASQWSPAPPGIGDTAFIPAGTVTHGQDNNDIIGELFDYAPFKMAAGTLTVAGTAYLAASPPDTPVPPHLVQIGGSLIFGGGATVYGIFQTGGLLDFPNGGAIVGGPTIQGTLEIDAGALTINQDQTGLSTLVLDGKLGGTITGDGTLVISNAVNQTLEPGLALSVATLVADGVNVASTNKGEVIVGANLSYSGALLSTARGTIGLSGHTLTALGPVALQGVLLGTGVLMIQNTGTLAGVIGGGATVAVNGTVTAASEAGDLTLDAAGSMLRVATAAGTLNLMGGIASGFSAAGTLALAGGTVDTKVDSTVQVPLSGTGSILVDSGKTLTLAGAVSFTGLIDGVGALVLTGGQATLAPGAGKSVAIGVASTTLQAETLTVAVKLVDLTQFSMDSASTLDIRAAATLDGGSDAATLDGLVTDLAASPTVQTLTLASGLITQGLAVNDDVELLVGGRPNAHSTVTGTLDLGPQGAVGGSFVNAVGSTLTVTEGSTIHSEYFDAFTNLGVINLVGATLSAYGTNSGTIVVTAGTDTEVSSLVGALTNSGTVQIDSGVLKITGAYTSSGLARLQGDGTVEFASFNNHINGTHGYTMPITIVDNTGGVFFDTPSLNLQGLQEAAVSAIGVSQNTSIITAAALGGLISDLTSNASLYLLDGGNLIASTTLDRGIGLRNEAIFTIANSLQIGDGSNDGSVLFNDGTTLLKDGAAITAQGSGEIVNGPTAVLASAPTGSGTIEVAAPVVNFGSIAVRSGTLKLDQRVTTIFALTGSIEVQADTQLELGHFVDPGTTVTVDAGGILRLDSLPAITDGTVEAHIGAGIVIANFVATGSSYSNGVMTLTDGIHSPALHLGGLDTGEKFLVSRDGFGGTVISAVQAACFAAGTRILTGAGEVAVEDLRVGDQVWAHGGDLRMTLQPIVWIGHRRLDCGRHPAPEMVWPVRIATGAFGTGRPRRELWLSPDHAVFVSDVLIPIRHLVNGRTVAQVPVHEVTYFHVELPTHSVMLAEGLPGESYLDTGNRAAFANGGATVMHPDFACHVWEANACARLVVTGPELDAIRGVLDAVAIPRKFG